MTSASTATFLTLAYFAFLGTGFMFLVLSFIQKMVLPLENPSYAAAVVLSLGPHKFGNRRSVEPAPEDIPKTCDNPSPLAIGPLRTASSSYCDKRNIPLFTENKILSFFFILMPAGILIGTPFPLGLSFLSKTRPRLIPPGPGSKRLFLCPLRRSLQ